MKKFNQLSRAEMKNVSGGNLKACTLTCHVMRSPPTPEFPDGTYTNVTTVVPDCTDATESMYCLRDQVLSCSCSTM